MLPSFVLISGDVELRGASDVIAKRRSSGRKVHQITNQARVLNESYNGRD